MIQIMEARWQVMYSEDRNDNLTLTRRSTMKTQLRSKDLSCPSCVAKIEKALQTLEGVASAKVHFTTGRIEVDHDPDRVSSEELADSLKDIGYNVRVSAF